MKKNNEWLSLKDASEYASITRRTLALWMNDPSYPKMKIKKIGVKKYVLKSELERNKKIGKGPKLGKLGIKNQIKNKKSSKVQDKKMTEQMPSELQGFCIEQILDDDNFKDKPLQLWKLREEFLRIREQRFKIENENKTSRRGFISMREAMKMQVRILHEIDIFVNSYMSGVAPVVDDILKLPKKGQKKKAIHDLQREFIKSWAAGWRGNMARVAHEMKKQIESQGCIVDVDNNFNVIEVE